MSDHFLQKKQKKWVLYSSDASIVAGQYSILAIFETLFVLVFYFWLAYQFDYQWWLYLAAMAAPLILLRSKASVERGVKLLDSYRNQSEDDVSKKEKILVGAFLTITSFIVSFYLVTLWNNNTHGVELFLRLSFIAFIASLIAVGIAYAYTYVFDLVITASTIVGFFAVVMMILVFTFAVFGGFLTMLQGVATLISLISSENEKSIFDYPMMIILSGLASGAGGAYLIRQQAVSLHQIFHTLGMALGVWLRSLFIRMIATLQYPIQGVRQLPINLQEILWKVDLIHLPELLPKSKQVDEFFSVSGVIKQNNNKDWITRISIILMAISWYIPALLWRWSLKATLWLWWPIALILRSPFEGKTLANKRDITAWRVNGLSKRLVVLPITVLAWLLFANFPQFQPLIEVLPDHAQVLLKQLKSYQITVPDMGFRQIILWLCSIIMLIIWFVSRHLAVVHKRILEDETTLDNLNEESRKNFIKRVERLDKLLTIRIVAFIFLGYSYLLYFVYKHYPNDVIHFIPVRLIPYL